MFKKGLLETVTANKVPERTQGANDAFILS
jgi:hypothetical protein